MTDAFRCFAVLAGVLGALSGNATGQALTVGLSNDGKLVVLERNKPDSWPPYFKVEYDVAELERGDLEPLSRALWLYRPPIVSDQIESAKLEGQPVRSIVGLDLPSAVSEKQITAILSGEFEVRALRCASVRDVELTEALAGRGLEFLSLGNETTTSTMRALGVRNEQSHEQSQLSRTLTMLELLDWRGSSTCCLVAFSKLRHLDLYASQVDDLSGLSEHPDLMSLGLGRTAVSRRIALQLRDLRSLRVLSLDGAAIDSDVFVELSVLPIHYLSIGQIAGLDQEAATRTIAAMPQLRTVMVRGTLTKSSIAELRRRRPEVEILTRGSSSLRER